MKKSWDGPDVGIAANLVPSQTGLSVDLRLWVQLRENSGDLHETPAIIRGEYGCRST